MRSLLSALVRSEMSAEVARHPTAAWSEKMVPMEPLAIPPNLRAAAEEDGLQWWLDTLPRTVADLTERWALKVAAPFEPGGNCAWVAPATDAAGAQLVLKLGWRHPEADHEADGLREW